MTFRPAGLFRWGRLTMSALPAHLVGVNNVARLSRDEQWTVGECPQCVRVFAAAFCGRCGFSGEASKPTKIE